MSNFEGFPLIIGWEITLACNLCCEHCGSTAGLPRPHELSLTEALEICNQFSNLLVIEVDFTGGEPLLCSYLWKVAIRLHDMKIKTKLITNGVLLGPDIIGQLKDVGISRVGVSLDGLKETHDHIRRKDGLFEHVITSLEQLQLAEIPVTVITTVNALNIDQLPDLYFILRSLNVGIWQFQPLFPLGRASKCLNLSLSEDQYLQLGNFYKDFGMMNSESKPVITPGDSFGYFTDFDLRQPQWGGCSAGMDICGITSDGHIKGCLSMPDELSEGDLRQRDLWDIWFDEDSFSFNRKFSTTNLGPNCYKCEHAAICRGGCTSMSYSCTGKRHNDPYCFSRLQKSIC
jgi:radical SAM protein with 4Fe4S-binding SPASM domain